MQSHVRIRLCMLGTSCVVLPRKLERMLTAAELDLLNTEFAKQGLGSLITGIDHES